MSARAAAAAEHPSPRIAAVGAAFPPHRHDQADLLAALQEQWGTQPAAARWLASFHRNVGVDGRHLAKPLDWYGPHRTFGETNTAWIEVAQELGEAAIDDALGRAGLERRDVDVLVTTTVTGVASPSLDARLVNRMGLRPDLVRVPLFGLGCVAGAAGTSRAADLLAGRPDAVAVLLSVELCSLTLQLGDLSAANLVSSALFGDGATAAVVVGAGRPAPGPRIEATRSIFHPDTEDVMGWKVSERGFEIVLSADVPTVVRSSLRRDVDAFLASRGLSVDDVTRWVLHPGGPKVLAAARDVLELDDEAVEITERSLRRVGNLSSSSVLLVLKDTLEERPGAPGEPALMIAMGPGFCTELVLLRW